MDQESDKEKKQTRFIIVPDFIIDDSDIPDGEKLLFGEIASNSLEKGFCWFSNKHLMERFHIGERTASRWVNDLRKKGYITINIVKRKNSEDTSKLPISIQNEDQLLVDINNVVHIEEDNPKEIPLDVNVNINYPKEKK
mgnify:CR=1 FL=1